MGKINPFRLQRPVRPVHDVNVVDGQHDGVEFNFRLRQLDALDQHRSAERGEDLVDDYIKGRDGNAPRDFPAVGDGDGMEVVKPTETLCQTAAVIEAMQPDDAVDRYTAEELIAIAVTCPNAWIQLLSISTRINRGELPNV
jgi:hypothetical protein